MNIVTFLREELTYDLEAIDEEKATLIMVPQQMCLVGAKRQLMLLQPAYVPSILCLGHVSLEPSSGVTYRSVTTPLIRITLTRALVQVRAIARNNLQNATPSCEGDALEFQVIYCDRQQAAANVTSRKGECFKVNTHAVYFRRPLMSRQYSLSRK